MNFEDKIQRINQWREWKQLVSSHPLKFKIVRLKFLGDKTWMVALYAHDSYTRTYKLIDTQKDHWRLDV